MSDNLIICRKCVENLMNEPYSSPLQYRGFFTYFKVPEDHICPSCKANLEEVEITKDDAIIILDISTDPKFIEAMISLKEKDIIEYQLKMSQFRNQAQQQKQTKVEDDNKVKCPYCKSTNVKKISFTSKATSIVGLGILSKKIGKQWHCNSCKSDF